MTVERLLDEMSAAEFMMWRAFDAIDPIGDERADAHAAQIAALIANVHRDTRKRRAPFRTIDFMLFTEKPQQDPNDLFRALRAALFTGKR